MRHLADISSFQALMNQTNGIPEGFPQNLSQLKRIRKLPRGKTDPFLYEDRNKQLFAVKGNENNNYSPECAQNETVADRFYRDNDVPASHSAFVPPGVKVSRFIEGKPLNKWWNGASQQARQKMQRTLRRGFPVDVLLDNDDFIGDGGNILVDKYGIPHRIDNDHALMYWGDEKRAINQDAEYVNLYRMLGRGADAGMSPEHDATNVQKYIGRVPLGQIVGDISNRDWSGSVRNLSPEARKLIEMRLRAVRQIKQMYTELRGRGLPEHEVEGYINRFVRQIADKNNGFLGDQYASRLGHPAEKPIQGRDLDSLLDRYKDLF